MDLKVNEMDLANKQVTFHKPTQISNGLNEGIRALAERYNGNIQAATEHCLERVANLTEARLTRSRAKNPPRSTRDGASLMTLLWVLLVDGLQPQRQPQAVREWLREMFDATDLLEQPLNEDNLPTLVTTFTQSLAFNDASDQPTPEIIHNTLMRVWSATTASDPNPRILPTLNRLFVGREADTTALHERLGVMDKSRRQALTIVRGWPGVGKTALINNIVYDEAVKSAFTQGVLWDSLGKNGDVLATLRSWARQLGALHLLQLQSLRDFKCLLLVS
jgi:hypothetical protein